LSAEVSTRGSTRGGFASGEGFALGGQFGNFKMGEKARKFSRKAGSPTERLLDYGVEIDETRELSNIIAKLTITAKGGK